MRERGKVGKDGGRSAESRQGGERERLTYEVGDGRQERKFCTGFVKKRIFYFVCIH